MQKAPGAKLVDVRNGPSGTIRPHSGSVQIEWQTYPGSKPNPNFPQRAPVTDDTQAVVMFLCRSGAPIACRCGSRIPGGYSHSYNVLQGFRATRMPAVTATRSAAGRGGTALGAKLRSGEG